MAEPAAAAARAPRWLMIVLALSLVLNLFQIGGFAYAHWLHRPMWSFEAHMRQTLASVAQTEPQKQAATRFLDQLHADHAGFEQAERNDRLEIAAELHKPDADLDRVHDLMTRSIKAREALMLTTSDDLIELLRVLPQDQRVRLIEVTLPPPHGGPGERPGPPPGPPAGPPPPGN